jgi:hypothetical protein
VTEEPADDRRPSQPGDAGSQNGAASSSRDKAGAPGLPEPGPELPEPGPELPEPGPGLPEPGPDFSVPGPGLPEPGPGFPEPGPDLPGLPDPGPDLPRLPEPAPDLPDLPDAGPELSGQRPPVAEQPRQSAAPNSSSRQPGPSRPASQPPPGRWPGPAPRSRGAAAQGNDLLNEFQRWLIKSSAKNLRRELGGQVRKTLGADRAKPEDVWGTVTTEPPPGQATEAPECAWCPVCRAARRLRESGPGVGSQLAGAGDAVAMAVTDALEALNAALSRAGRPDQPGEASSEEPVHGPDHRD